MSKANATTELTPLQIVNLTLGQSRLVQEIVERAADGVPPSSEEWTFLTHQKINPEELESRVRRHKKIQGWREIAGTAEHRQALAQARDAAQQTAQKEGGKLAETIRVCQEKIQELNTAATTAERAVEAAERMAARLTDTKPGVTVLPEHVLHEIKARETELYQQDDFKQYVQAPGRLRYLERVIAVEYGDGTGEELVRLAKFQSENPDIKPIQQPDRGVQGGSIVIDTVPREAWEQFVDKCRDELERLTEWYAEMKTDVEAREAEIKTLTHYYVK